MVEGLSIETLSKCLHIKDAPKQCQEEAINARTKEEWDEVALKIFSNRFLLSEGYSISCLCIQ